jgi:hypothetical protein
VGQRRDPCPCSERGFLGTVVVVGSPGADVSCGDLGGEGLPECRRSCQRHRRRGINGACCAPQCARIRSQASHRIRYHDDAPSIRPPWPMNTANDSRPPSTSCTVTCRSAGDMLAITKVRRRPSSTPRSVPASRSIRSTTNNSRWRRPNGLAEAATRPGRSTSRKFSTASTAPAGTKISRCRPYFAHACTANSTDSPGRRCPTPSSGSNTVDNSCSLM